MADFKETVIDHVGGIGCANDSWCGVSTGETWLVNKLERLAKEYPEDIECIAKNKDGSVYYHVPWEWVKIRKPIKLSQEERERRAEIIKDSRAFKKK